MLNRFNANKFKTQCKLCASRIKLMRNKKQLSLHQTRKEVAELLRSNKQGNARIRVETVIREAYLLQAYDILELFLELLSVRTELLEKSKRMPVDMVEALASIVYAANRLSDFPELPVLRGLLGSKYGKEFIQEAGSDETCRKWHCNDNLVRCLSIEAPAPEEKLQTLSDIAQQFGVEWDAAAAARDMLPPSDPSLGGPGMGMGPGGPLLPPGGGPGMGGGMGGGGSITPSGAGSVIGDEVPELLGPDGLNPGGTMPSLGGAGATAPGLGGVPGGMGGAAGGGMGGHVAGMGGAPAGPPRPFARPPGGGGGARVVQQSESDILRHTMFGPTALRPGAAAPGAEGEYADASAAAEAARNYSHQAQQAADAAERLARGGGGGSGGEAEAFPLIKPMAGVAPSSYVQRSESDIQREYDAIPAPAKPPSLQPGPSAPPPPSGLVGGSAPFHGSAAGMGSGSGASAGAPAANGKGNVAAAGPGAVDPGLPSPPRAAAGSPPRGGAPNELDELAKRFEMLKRR